MKRTIRAVMLAAGLAGGFGTAWADAEALTKQLRQQMPPNTHVEVRPAPVPGLYEVTLDGKVVYMSEDGRYVLNGALLDLKTNRNLTEAAQRKARLRLMQSLRPEEMITYPAQGEQKRALWVFDDIHCPYCRKFHRIIPKLQAAGVTVHVVFYPRAGVNSQSFRDAVAVWCSADRNRALDAAMLKGEIPKAGGCRHPLATHLQLAERIGVTGTPYLVLDDGEAVPGYVPPDKLIPYLLSSSR